MRRLKVVPGGGTQEVNELRVLTGTGCGFCKTHGSTHPDRRVFW